MSGCVHDGAAVARVRAPHHLCLAMTHLLSVQASEQKERLSADANKLDAEARALEDAARAKRLQAERERGEAGARARDMKALEQTGALR